MLGSLFCIYGFSGYLDAGRRLRSTQVLPGLLVVATFVAFGQTGGIDGIRTKPGR